MNSYVPYGVSPSASYPVATWILDPTEPDAKALVFGTDFFLRPRSDQKIAVAMAKSLPTFMAVVYPDGCVVFTTKAGIKFVSHGGPPPVSVEFDTESLSSIIVALTMLPAGISHIVLRIEALGKATPKTVHQFFALVRKGLKRLSIEKHDRSLPAWLCLPIEVFMALNPQIGVWQYDNSETHLVYDLTWPCPELKEPKTVIWRRQSLVPQTSAC